ncbi:MAG TPA: CvpA family protein [Acidobacteriota bacterium]|nr:CvpA family protein [Acidobacteriota bacterium]
MSLSQWTFLDFVFALIIVLSTGFALTKGLVRELISLVALVGGFVLAALYHPVTAHWFMEFTRNESVANLIGFMLIFLGCIVVGAVAAFLVNRFVKMASLEWVDRLLGAVYGFLRGWAIASIIILALIAFPVRENLLARSYLAPYLLAGARLAAYAVPQDMKSKFNDEYKKVLQQWNQNRSSK